MTTRFFFPALFLMSRLSFLHKFILISALFIMPLVGFVYLLSSQMALDSQVASKEMDGDRYLAPLRAALSHAIEEKIAAHAHYVHGAAPHEMLPGRPRSTGMFSSWRPSTSRSAPRQT